jgi:MscS family membrane protein
MGVVEAIGPRSSRLRGLDGTLTTVPNADLAKMHVTNYSVRNKCLLEHVIGLRYETSPAQFEWLLARLRKHVAAHPMVEEDAGMPRVRIVGFGESSINVEVRANVLTSDWGEFLGIQEELILAIMRIVDAAGSGFAFPSRTVYVGSDDGLHSDRKSRAERHARRKDDGRGGKMEVLQDGPRL